MATVLIIYYSRSGNTEKMADYVREGVESEGVAAKVSPVSGLHPSDLLEPEGIIIGSPTYYGGMAAEIKSLLDQSVSYHGKLVGKVGGAPDERAATRRSFCPEAHGPCDSHVRPSIDQGISDGDPNGTN